MIDIFCAAIDQQNTVWNIGTAKDFFADMNEFGCPLDQQGRRADGDTRQPSPEITVSDSEKDEDVTTSSGTLTGTVSLVAGTGLGEDADWWIAANTSSDWFYYNLALGWVSVGDPSGLLVTYQGPLFDLTPPIELLNFSMSGLPSGTYRFYFAVDTDMNGVLDLDKMVFDLVEVIIP